MPVLKDYKKDFPWFKNNQDLVYLDNAATTLKPQITIDAINEYYTKYSSNPHSDNRFAVIVYNEIEETRKTLAKFIQADKEEVMFTSGATESINTIANAMQDILKKDDEVIITYMEHSANLLPWYKLRQRIGVKLVFVNKDTLIIDKNEILNALTKKTRLVAFTGASNLLADEVDIKGIIQGIKEYNDKIFTLVDSTQYIEHFPLKCHDFNLDFAVGSGHKMIAPTGTGFLYIKKDLYDEINPLKYGGDMNESIYEDHFVFAKNNHKFEGGTPNVAGLYAWKKSLNYLMNIGSEEIIKREVLLKKYFLQNMPKRDDFILYNPSENTPLITFNFKDKENKIIESKKVEEFLQKYNILVRSGLSCAKLATHNLNAQYVVRASMLFYNDYHDIDKLIQALNQWPK